MVDEGLVASGLRDLGLGPASTVIVHSSLSSFGHVVGGAHTVAKALVATGATVVVPSGTWDHTGVRPPPGLTRENNAATPAPSWSEFETALAQARPFDRDLPIDRALGAVPEALRTGFEHQRGEHPLFSFLAIGPHAREVIAAARLDWPLGPIDVVDALGGEVLLLGVDHTRNTTIHVAEQRMGRSRFFRYAKVADGVWMELPNVSGESHRFNEIEPLLAPATIRRVIGKCEARLIPVRSVLEAATTLIAGDAGALLCEDDACRCVAARRQRELWLAR